MKKSVLVLMMVLMVAMSFIAVSCGAKKTTLELYYYKQENQEGFKAVLDAYTKVDPTVAFKTLIIPNDADAAMSARAAQNKLPDLMQMQSYSRVTEYASKGYLVDLSADPVLTMVVDGSKPAVT